MSQNLLSRLLSQKISLECILKWIHTEVDCEENKQDFSCSQGEFISHVLNFIHEEALCFESYRETPKKVHTPKAIRKMEVTKPKRRSALFTDTPKSSPRAQPLSPVSPLYTRFNNSNDYTPSPSTPSQGLYTPKGKAFCLGDFITPRKSDGKKFKTPNSKTPEVDCKERRKRINPTNIGARNMTFRSENSFNFSLNQEVPEVPEKFEKTCQEDPIPGKVIVEAEKMPKVIPKLQPKEILPNLSQVTHISELKVLVTLYVDLIQSSRVLNVSSELYFILTLLLSKQYDGDYFSSAIFVSIHNVTYFALNSLQKIVHNSDSEHVLNILDKSSLRLLATNTRVQLLDTEGLLIAKILALGEEPVEKMKAWRLSDSPSDKNVCFDAETDNRENFPTDASFHAFRKQRDVFYELLQVWEGNHSSDGWSFAQSLGNRLRGLLGMHPAPANYRHLARLIKSQLLITCTRIQEDHLQENQLSFLTTIPNLNAEKLHRLKTRLVAKDQSTGINAPPTFPGAQEFYKELVVHSQSYIFCTHLRNIFIQDLLDLNETTFETFFDNDIKTPQNFSHIVRSLQLLAKFIGFIESLPYTTPGGLSQHLSDKLTLEDVEGRAWMTPPIDLIGKLRNAVRQRHLVVVIPWLVEYLAMMDATTLRLPYYEPIYEILFRVFLESALQLARVCLGWLFEQSNFPSELFFRYLNNRKVKTDGNLFLENGISEGSLHLVNLNAANLNVANLNVANLTVEAHSEISNDGLDNLIKVDLNLLHTICPFLREFQKLLQYNCGRNGSITSKHITPVTAIEAPTEINERRLRLQLQEAFLNSKPSSLRRTLDFVSERIASCVVKTICNVIVPRVKAEALAEKKVMFQDAIALELSRDEGPANSVKVEIRGKLLKMIEVKLEKLKTDCGRMLTSETEGKIRPGVVALLCSDELQETVDVCCLITGRLCRERVQQWINTRINLSVFKDFDIDIEKIDKLLQKERDDLLKSKFKSLPTQGQPHVAHIDSDEELFDATDGAARPTDICNPAKLLVTLQRECAHLLRDAKPPGYKTTNDDVNKLLGKARDCHEHRSDLSDITWHHLNQQVVDYFILLCTKQPHLLSTTLLSVFFTFWKNNQESYLKDLFIRVISVRNTMILMTSTAENLTQTWTIYSQFLGKLIREQLLTPEDFEAQCLAVFRENWNADTLARICQCLQDVVTIHGGKDQFAFLLGFLADYCSDLDF